MDAAVVDAAHPAPERGGTCVDSRYPLNVAREAFDVYNTAGQHMGDSYVRKVGFMLMVHFALAVGTGRFALGGAIPPIKPESCLGMTAHAW